MKRSSSTRILLETEYDSLGESLKQLTIESIAEKFDTNSAAITAVTKLEDDDLRLIRDLLSERRSMLSRRKQLRKLIC